MRPRRIHIFHSTSDIHLKYQFRINREEALKRSVEMVKLAKTFVDDVEFSRLWMLRGQISVPYLIDVVEAVIESGASTVNIPDTVGSTTPVECGKIIKAIKKEKIGDKAVISVHCHNDPRPCCSQLTVSCPERCRTGGMHHQRHRRASRVLLKEEEVIALGTPQRTFSMPTQG